MPALTAEQILTCKDLKVEKVLTPEWAPEGTDPAEAFVYIRCLSGAERDDWEAFMEKAKRKGTFTNARAKLCCMSICDEKGVRLFSDEDIKGLAAKSSLPLDRVCDAAIAFSSASRKTIEELKGNFGSAQQEDSPTD